MQIELFLDDYLLPQPLSYEETCTLFKSNSKEARDKLIIHNIRLVLFEVYNKFWDFDYDKRELVSIGNVGLIKAVDSFDITRDIKFTTYAAKCIDNEILTFLKSQRKHSQIDSFEKVCRVNKCNSEVKLKDLLYSDNDMVEDYENEEIDKIIRNLIEELPDIEKEIVKLYFGFYDNRVYSQREIAEKFNFSQSYVSRFLLKIMKKIETKLYKNQVFELKRIK